VTVSPPTIEPVPQKLRIPCGKTITLFRVTAFLTALSHPGTNADLQSTAVSSIAYKEALIS